MHTLCTRSYVVHFMLPSHLIKTRNYAHFTDKETGSETCLRPRCWGRGEAGIWNQAFPVCGLEPSLIIIFLLADQQGKGAAQDSGQTCKTVKHPQALQVKRPRLEISPLQLLSGQESWKGSLSSNTKLTLDPSSPQTLHSWPPNSLFPPKWIAGNM